jgi:beta-lactamase regulating signal transducer with metallopeptidase domain
MQPIYLNSFFNATAIALLNSLWQMAFLYLVYLIINAVFLLSPKAKFNVLTGLQFIGFSWFIYTFSISLNTSIAIISTNFNAAILPKNNLFLNTIFPLLSTVYLFFVLVFFVQLFIQIFTAKKAINHCTYSTFTQCNVYVQNICKQLHISKKIVLKTTLQNVVPYTIGYIKPIIVLPIAAINNLSAQELEAILLHEIAHIKRQDYVINMLLMMIEGIMCFNPFAKIINKEIAVERELCCDDIVINYPYPATQYAKALLHIATTQIDTPFCTVNLFAFNSQYQLKNRINRMLNMPTVSKNNNLQFAFILLFGLLIFSAVAFINNQVQNVVVYASNNVATNNRLQKVVFVKNNEPKNRVVVNTLKIVEPTKNKQLPQKTTPKIPANYCNATLENSRQFIANGFKKLAEDIVENNETYQVKNINEENFFIEDSSNIAIVAAVKKEATTHVQRFLISATSKSAASIIVVTTTTKNDGTKQVKIEFEKGSGVIE